MPNKKPQPAEGQIWAYGKVEKYRLSNLRPQDSLVTITRVEQDNSGVWVRHSSGNENGRYNLASVINSDSWRYIESPMRECGECGEEKEIPADDFLCAECREAIPLVSRLVADVDNNPTIIQFSSSSATLTVIHDGVTIIIRREDMPGKAEEALKKFLDPT